ncbi:MBL fold metallo-hydrolase RNA specificity domain-containing protein [Acetobacterium carbinolicum]|jgi:metallo-beta-lactamase family protein|uniref:MBL fold metallo-hydrolase RNA specificity domain-containing protein n=1 Tax=Acetobacterium TaxID=33951 RepID=UPI000DBEABF2|nr:MULTISPECIES: MBL fold metallo-hydrolase [unclassified Acetobacterium]AWW25460.1 MBL fold metallo-hydrolase [Acetobacterium sp. KB-1]MDZ5723972.1 MBL fold metallo-hydrolase [Acetobacterium sp. K1/6]
MKIKFLGAALSVTGSCHLVTTEHCKFLLDCGLFQGSEALEELNNQAFDFNPKEIDFIILSHAHIDHCGRIPLLVKQGFSGQIYSTGATAEIADILLQDSGTIHVTDAKWINRRTARSGQPLVSPLYTQEDAARCIQYFFPVAYGQCFQVNPQIRIRLNEAGHILGAAIIEIWIAEGGKTTKLVYSGDIGASNQRMLNDPTLIAEADYLIMETTYGDRTHETRWESGKRFLDIVFKTVARGGTVVVPAFALGRTQDLIHELEVFYDNHELYQNQLDKVKVYVDSPLATDATEIFRKNAHYFNDYIKERIKKGDELFYFRNLSFTKSIDESKALNENTSPKIIISSSGMADAGRVQHHLKHNLWKPQSSIVFAGYQAEGTIGRAITSGEKYIRILRERIRVNAEIYFLEGFSAHADKNDLLKWLSGFKEKPKKIFLVHGEEEAKKSFANTAKNTLGFDCTVVEDVSEYDLDNETVMVDGIKNRIDTKNQINKLKDNLDDIHNELGNLLAIPGIGIKGSFLDEKREDLAVLTRDLEKTCEKLKTVINK